MLSEILTWDRELFLALNQVGCNDFIDRVFEQISNKYFWIPAYLVLAYFLITRHEKIKWGLLALLGCGLAVGLADFTSVHAFKNVFERLRPCHAEELQGLVQTLRGKCGGQYGFVSSHSANSFAIAFFVLGIKIFPKRINYILLGWAGVVAYSRVYLGVHYPLDIVCGAILGGGLAYGCSQLFLRFKNKDA